METAEILVEGRGTKVWTICINRPLRKNAVNGSTAEKLHAIFLEFDSDMLSCVAILHGLHGTFCAGADLFEMSNPLFEDVHKIGPMGISRLQLNKPVIAAIEGFCVAGGLELALWCDLRVASESAVFGVFCRRWGVPLIDGGTVRLPRIIGQGGFFLCGCDIGSLVSRLCEGRAMDMILTGREVLPTEALAMGLVSRVVPTRTALEEATKLAWELCALPQTCMRMDRKSSLEQWGMANEMEALSNEFVRGLTSLQSGEAAGGASKFKAGAGRGGTKSNL